MPRYTSSQAADIVRGLSGRDTDGAAASSPYNAVEQVSGQPRFMLDALIRALAESFGQYESIFDRAPGSPPIIYPANKRYAALPRQFTDIESELTGAQKAQRADERKQTYDLFQRELDASRHLNSHEAAAARLDAATQPSDGFMNSFVRRFQDQGLAALQEEAAENYYDRIKPQLANEYIKGGRWYSGAHKKAEIDAENKLKRQLHRDSQHFMRQLHHDAHQMHQAESAKHLQAADITGRMVDADREAALIRARERQAGLGRHEAAEISDRAQRLEAARIRHAQEQRKAEAEHAEHVETIAEPERRLGTLMSHIAGVGHAAPVRTVQHSGPATSPIAPNPYAMGAGYGGILTGMSQMAPFKAGGHVRRGFAEGGDTSFPQYSDAELPAFNTPEMNHLRETMKGLPHSVQNPYGYGMVQMGANILANQHNPSLGFARGAMGFMNEHKAAHNERHNRHMQALEIAHNINKSRLDQQTLLAKWKHERDILNEQKRMHDSQIDLHKAHAEHYRRMPMEQPPIKLDSADQYILKKNADNYQVGQTLLDDLDKLEKLAPKIKSGGISGYIPAWFDADKEEFDKITNNFVAQATKAFGSRGGQKMAQIIEKGKPNRSVTPEGNLRNIRSMRKGILNELKAADFINEALDHGVSPKKAQAVYSRWERMKDKNPDLDVTPFDLLGIKGKEWVQDVEREEKPNKSSSNDYTDEEIMAALQ